jgi:hypothetical protein
VKDRYELSLSSPPRPLGSLAANSIIFADVDKSMASLLASLVTDMRVQDEWKAFANEPGYDAELSPRKHDDNPRAAESNTCEKFDIKPSSDVRQWLKLRAARNYMDRANARIGELRQAQVTDMQNQNDWLLVAFGVSEAAIQQRVTRLEERHMVR